MFIHKEILLLLRVLMSHIGFTAVQRPTSRGTKCVTSRSGAKCYGWEKFGVDVTMWQTNDKSETFVKQDENVYEKRGQVVDEQREELAQMKGMLLWKGHHGFVMFAKFTFSSSSLIQ